MGRPSSGQEHTTIGIFKVAADGVTAERVQVAIGRSSVNSVEVVSGLQAGDKVILSDMSAWDGFDRVRLR
jgi:multidrug efflux pump subunit AcrA (membrane-fusion protein)